MKKNLTKALVALSCALTASSAYALPYSTSNSEEQLEASKEQTVTAKELTIDRIYSSPSLAGQTPRSLKFSPDGSRVTYLQGKKRRS